MKIDCHFLDGGAPPVCSSAEATVASEAITLLLRVHCSFTIYAAVNVITV